MNYEFVKGIGNVNPVFSSACYIWKHRKTGIYYISNDYKEIIKPVIDNSYMLLFDKSETKLSPYRYYLSQNAKQLTAYDFSRGVVEYNKSHWKLN